MRLTRVLPILLACASALPGLDVVSVSAPSPVAPESTTTDPLRFRVERTGGTGLSDVTLRLGGTAVLGADYTISGILGGLSVDEISVINGGEYLTVPAVTVSPATGDTTGGGCTALAVLGVGRVRVTQVGAYSATPRIEIVGNGAAASAVPVTYYRLITSASKSSLVSAGSRDVVGSEPAAGGRAARGRVTVTAGSAVLEVGDIGSGYAIGETITFAFTDGVTQDSISGQALYGIGSVVVRSTGRDYTTTPTVNVLADAGTEFTPASLVAALSVVDVEVVASGTAYSRPPVVSIAPGVAQASAAATAFRTTVRIQDGQRDAVMIASPVADNEIELAETVQVDILPGSGYVTGSKNTINGTIADDDITTRWAVVDSNTEETLQGDPPAEATVSVTFAGNPGSSRPLTAFSRLIQFQPQPGGATLNADYVLTYMHRHPGQPVKATMRQLRTSDYEFDDGWQIPEGETTEAGDTVIPYQAVSFGTLSVGDIIQFGSNNRKLHRVVAIGGDTISITPGLSEAVPAGTLIRNNISLTIEADGDIQGVYAQAGLDTAIDLTVTPLYDNLPEGAESVLVRLLGSNDYVLADPQVQSISIGDDDAVVDITLLRHAGEPSSQGSALVTLSSPLPRDLIVSYAVSGTAVAGSDYDALPGTVTIPEGETSVPIPVVPRLDADNDVESVTITLVDTPDYKLAGSDFGEDNPATTVNILDSAGTVRVAVQDASAAEAETASAANPGRFRISIDGTRGPGSPAVSVLYAVSGSANPGADYTVLSGQATIPSGQSGVNVDLLVLDDELVEGSESVTLTLLSSAGYGVSATGAVATIQIQDDEPTMAISGVANTSEPAGTVLITVGYAGPALNRAFDVPYLLTGSAVAGVDFGGLSGTASIPAGESSTTFTLNVIDDTLAEGPETVVLTLQPRPIYSLDPAATVATLQITDDEPAVSVSATAGVESGAPVRVTFAIDRSLARDLAIGYTISGGSAVAGADYVLPYAGAQGTVTLPAGSLTAILNVATLNDSVVEGDEDFVVTIQNASTYTVVSGSAAVAAVILDDEPTVEVVATTANAFEGGATGLFTIRNTGALRSSPLIVGYTTSGTATSGSDFVPLPGTAVIPAGRAAVDVVLTPVDDAAIEPAETVIIALIAPADASYGLASASTATVVITDDDAAPTPGKPPTGSGSGGGGGCGLGSGLAALLGALGMALRLGLRRRR